MKSMDAERKTKEEIRRRLKKERSALTERRWMEDSGAAAAILTGLACFREARHIYCYVDMGSEIRTREIIREAWRRDKQVWVPKVRESQIRFYELTGLDHLRPGTYGILEPEEGREGDGEEGLAIVPGVAFDEALNRLGYGGGYYDRFLSGHPGLFRVGLAFELQLVKRVPTEPFDQPMDLLVTERRVYDGNGTSQRPGDAP